MATFTDLIKSSKVKAAFLKRNATLREINNKALSIDELDKETPNVKTFERLETNAIKSLEELKAVCSDLNIVLENENSDIANDESYIANKNNSKNMNFHCLMQLKIIFSCLTTKVLNIPLTLNL